MAGNYEANRKWRAGNPEARQAQNDRRYEKTMTGERRRWTPEEDLMILSTEVSDMALAKLLKRGERAIHVRRSKLKKGTSTSPPVD